MLQSLILHCPAFQKRVYFLISTDFYRIKAFYFCRQSYALFCRQIDTAPQKPSQPHNQFCAGANPHYPAATAADIPHAKSLCGKALPCPWLQGRLLKRLYTPRFCRVSGGLARYLESGVQACHKPLRRGLFVARSSVYLPCGVKVFNLFEFESGIYVQSIYAVVLYRVSVAP